MTITNPLRVRARSGEPAVGPQLVLIGALAAILTVGAVFHQTMSGDALLPSLSTLFFIMAAVVALIAWQRPIPARHFSYWDAAGILTVHAYRAVPASTLAPLQYFEIVSATIFGWLVFGNFPDAIKWLGIFIIIGSGLYILWRERRFASKPVSDTSATAFTP